MALQSEALKLHLSCKIFDSFTFYEYANNVIDIADINAVSTNIHSDMSCKFLPNNCIKFQACASVLCYRHNDYLFVISLYTTNLTAKVYTLAYYHLQIGSMKYYPLFRVRSWNNGMRCMFLYIPLTIIVLYPFKLCSADGDIGWKILIGCHISLPLNDVFATCTLGVMK